MRQVAIGLVLILTLLPVLIYGQEESYQHRAGLFYSLGNAIAGEKPNFTFNHGYGFYLGTGAHKWGLNLSLLIQNNYSDGTASGHFGFFADKNQAEYEMKSIRAGLDMDYRLRKTGLFQPKLTTGLGYLIWRYFDPAGDTVIQTVGSKGNTVDFSAAELFLSSGLGMEIRAARRVILDVCASFDYLTGIGTDFSDATNDNRSRAVMRIGIKAALRFGSEARKQPQLPVWPTQESWEEPEKPRRETAERDSDGDGIIDRKDDCPNTPLGAVVDNSGCPGDSDSDGILDGLDDCPATPKAAAGYIDVFGCPIDTDYDGVPDYRDHCREGPAGAMVDSIGCPVDSDGDGVYDGLDDCPGTRAGIEVDERGCIDISFLHEAMIVNIDYLPGSFEVDERTKRRMQPLIEKLRILSDVRIKILGYTDNIGPAEANQILSQKRADRMRDWLESQGINRDRMETSGRGEINFIASNQTADGRAKNRRIELIFER